MATNEVLANLDKILVNNPYAGFDVGTKVIVYDWNCIIPLYLLSMGKDGFTQDSVDTLTKAYASVMTTLRSTHSRLYMSANSNAYCERNAFGTLPLNGLGLTSILQYLMAQYVAEAINMPYKAPYTEVLALSYPRTRADYIRFLVGMAYSILQEGVVLNKNGEAVKVEPDERLLRLDAPHRKEGNIIFGSVAMSSFLKPLIKHFRKISEQVNFLSGALGQYVGTVLAAQLDERYLPAGMSRPTPGVTSDLDWSYCMYMLTQQFVELSMTSSSAALAQNRVVYLALKNFLYPKAWFKKEIVSYGPKHSVFVIPPSIPIPEVCDRIRVSQSPSEETSTYEVTKSSGSSFVQRATTQAVQAIGKLSKSIFNRLASTTRNGHIVIRDLCNGPVRHIADNTTAFYDRIDPVSLTMPVKIEPALASVLGSMGLKSYRGVDEIKSSLDIYATTYSPPQITSISEAKPPYSYFGADRDYLGYPLNSSERVPDMLVISTAVHSLGETGSMPLANVTFMRSDRFARDIFGTTEATLPFIMRDARMYANYLGWFLQNLDLSELQDFIDSFDLEDMRQLNTAFSAPIFNANELVLADHAFRLHLAYIAFALACYGSTYRAAFYDLVCANYTFLLQGVIKKAEAAKAYKIQPWKLPDIQIAQLR